MDIFKSFAKFYGNLQIGVLILEEDFSKAVYFNSAYATGFGIDEGSALKNENHLALVDGWRKNQNKNLGTLRFVPDDDGEILLFEALNSEIKISSDNFHLLLLIPIKSREKMHRTKPRESYQGFPRIGRLNS
jgi:hypothetical protein